MLQTAETTFVAERLIWRTVDMWAKTHGYRLVDWRATTRVYEKSHQLLRGFGRWRIQIDHEGHDVDLTTEVRFRHFSPPGPKREAFVQRARQDVNELLADLGQPALADED